MLKELNEALGATNDDLLPITRVHPMQLVAYLEAVWERRFQVAGAPIPVAAIPPLGGTAQDVLGLARAQLFNNSGVPLTFNEAANLALSQLEPGPGRTPRGTPWRHLMYAYLIENTRAYDIFERVLREALHDEGLGPMSASTHQWLRLTEDLFFREGTTSYIALLSSTVRRDACGIRRNAYQRLFNIDLNHGASDGKPFTFVRAKTTYADFVRDLQELLRELWRGYSNVRNTSGQNTTDTQALAELVRRLEIGMTSRRAPGGINLAREEFVAVATMEWFDLVLGSDNAVMQDLRAQGAVTPESRLQRIGERVGLPAHAKARSFFVLANGANNLAGSSVPAPGALPELLREIEQGVWANDIAVLFTPPGIPGAPPFPPAPPAPGAWHERTLEIINHWSMSTGVDPKAIAATVGAR